MLAVWRRCRPAWPCLPLAGLAEAPLPAPITLCGCFRPPCLQLATALRKAPFNVSILLGGVDKAPADASGAGSEAPACEPSLYWIDYMGTMSRVNYGAHGYGAYFTNGLLDRFWKAGMSEAEAVELMGRCLGELKMRFMLNQPNFTCYKISAAGVEAVEVSATSVPDVSGVPAPSEGAAAAAASSSSAAVTA